MPIQDNIEVSVMVNGEPLQEYTDKSLIEDHLHCRTRYIEVSKSSTFEIQVTFLPGFLTKGASFVNTRYYFDDNLNHGRQDYRPITKTIEEKGVLTEEIKTVHKALSCKNQKSGQWERCSLQFTKLTTPDNNSAREQLSSESISKAGRIRVICSRARRTKNRIPRGRHGLRPATNYVLPEFIPDAKEIKYKVIIPNGTPCNPPSPIIYEYHPIEGQHGTQYEFVFIYRHKEILKQLDIIPRSPVQTPVKPNHDQQLQGLASLLELEKNKNFLMMKQFKELQDRVQRLEPAATMTSGSGQRSIISYFSTDKRNAGNKDKRKRIEQGDDDDLEEIKPPPQKPKLVIEISDDE